MCHLNFITVAINCSSVLGIQLLHSITIDILGDNFTQNQFIIIVINFSISNICKFSARSIALLQLHYFIDIVFILCNIVKVTKAFDTVHHFELSV